MHEPAAHELTPCHLARLHRRATRALRTGGTCRIRPQTLLALCAHLAQIEAQLTEVDDTYQRLVEEHDASTANWVRLLELLGLSTWSSWSTVSETVVAQVEALVAERWPAGVATDEGGA